ncbi:hypothetical protein C7212DRAFT_316205 [Tuber magnatum]|uniref:Uncharacterized protein n=1 Tax=Tuber magnatum TaxID=42249 RepID=A0A317SYK5_9PEZI|nr:hypothetical protein C7212DRAFT_316205 [Tuber magnatum]
MTTNAPRRPVVIVQKAPSSSMASLSSMTTTSISRSNSITSIHSSNTSTSSTSQHYAPQEGHGSQTRPAEIVGDGVEFVETGRPQGGNPRGGPPQSESGYFRVSKSTVTVHNSGGQLTGSVAIDMGEAYANGSDHTDSCRKMSQKSDNQTLCFCPARPGSSS